MNFVLFPKKRPHFDFLRGKKPQQLVFIYQPASLLKTNSLLATNYSEQLRSITLKAALEKQSFSFEILCTEKFCRKQGIIQAVFEIGNRFWTHQNWFPNFDELAKKP